MFTRWMYLALVVGVAMLLGACGATSTSSDNAPVQQEQNANEEADARKREAPESSAVGEAEPAEEAQSAGDAASDDYDAAAGAEAVEEEAMVTDDGLDTAQSVPQTADGATLPETLPAEPAAAPPPPRPDALDEASGETEEADTTGASSEVEAMPEPLPSATVVPQTLEINPFVRTVDDNLSTFALDVDTASYTAARNYITAGQLPPPATVRIEEFVNYFHYDYSLPTDEVFNIAVDAAPSPFATETNTQIVRVGLQGKEIEASQRDDAILTFVIDISGSMSDPNRLPLVKESLGLLVNELRESDQIAIVVYSDNTRTVLDHTSAAERDTILQAIESLQIEGSTNVEDGLRLGYEVAARNYQNGAINRVILCSDGVANVGATSPDAIRETVRDYTAQGVLLTTVGFGMGDFNDLMMEQLANDGNGNYGYVDTIDAAERFFVEDLTGTLQVIAKDAKIQVEFNPEVVDRYRLLGYENRDVADADFRNNKVDAGEVGAGHNVTALYEVVLTEQGSGTALTVHLRYADLETNEVTEVQQPLTTEAFGTSFEEASPHFQLAVAVAGFAEQLRNSGYAHDRSLADVLTITERIAPQFANDQDFQEFMQLVEQATNL